MTGRPAAGGSVACYLPCQMRPRLNNALSRLADSGMQVNFVSSVAVVSEILYVGGPLTMGVLAIPAVAGLAWAAKGSMWSAGSLHPRLDQGSSRQTRHCLPARSAGAHGPGPGLGCRPDLRRPGATRRQGEPPGAWPNWRRASAGSAFKRAWMRRALGASWWDGREQGSRPRTLWRPSNSTAGSVLQLGRSGWIRRSWHDAGARQPPALTSQEREMSSTSNDFL